MFKKYYFVYGEDGVSKWCADIVSAYRVGTAWRKAVDKFNQNGYYIKRFERVK